MVNELFLQRIMKWKCPYDSQFTSINKKFPSVHFFNMSTAKKEFHFLLVYTHIKSKVFSELVLSLANLDKTVNLLNANNEYF